MTLNTAFEGIANDLRNVLVDTCPVDTGALKGSIRVTHQGKGRIEISMLRYGEGIEFGTPPHVIRPKNKKALHWGGKDGPVVKKVNHPGTRPNPFIRTTIHSKLKNIIATNLKRHLKND